MSDLLKLDPNFKPAFDGKIVAEMLVNKVLECHSIKKAILFGSCANQKNTANSDLDLLIVIPDSETKELYQKTVGKAFFSPVAVDWIFVTETEFEAKKESGGVCLVADKMGVVIYDSAK